MESLLLGICLFLAGCASSADRVAREAHRLAAERASLAAVCRELRDLSQIFLYAGRMRQDDVAGRALAAAQRIVGEPEEEEKQLALALTDGDVRRRSRRAERLLRERARHRQGLDGIQERLALSIPKLYAERSSLILHIFVGFGIFGLLASLLIRRRR
ncbi:MAG: hypothetical protein LBB14_02855 [Puniceicoccales bacterium]|nr:hypothetical protein [Puniceicoccales bacterium]